VKNMISAYCKSQAHHNAPKLAGNSQILTAPHQSIAFAAFRGGRNAGWVKVFLLSPGNSDKSRMYDHVSETAFSISRMTHLPRQTRAYSRLTIFGPTFVSLRGARPHPPGPKALFRIRRYLISGRYINPSITSRAQYEYESRKSRRVGALAWLHFHVHGLYWSHQHLRNLRREWAGRQAVVAPRPVSSTVASFRVWKNQLCGLRRRGLLEGGCRWGARRCWCWCCAVLRR
jgi:hypothetical protein